MFLKKLKDIGSIKSFGSFRSMSNNLFYIRIIYKYYKAYD